MCMSSFHSNTIVLTQHECSICLCICVAIPYEKQMKQHKKQKPIQNCRSVSVYTGIKPNNHRQDNIYTT